MQIRQILDRMYVNNVYGVLFLFIAAKSVSKTFSNLNWREELYRITSKYKENDREKKTKRKKIIPDYK